MFSEVVLRERVGRMEKMLYEVAVEGSVTSLLQLLHEDKLILDRFVVGCFPETPLHIAAMLGHVEFVNEIITVKPELAGELDFRRSSPLHLATSKGYDEIVKLLLSANPDMCFVQDWQGRNPLHIAVIKGRTDVLKELVLARPQAAHTLVGRGGTILHLCVKHKGLEALKLLVETTEGNHDFVNSKDEDGFTILHLAVADKQIEIISLLITTTTTLEVNALNANGFTALDMLERSQRDVKDIEIKESLQRVGALRAKYISDLSVRDDLAATNLSPASLVALANIQVRKKIGEEYQPDRHKNWLEQKRSTLLVVATLIAAMAFQAGINPSDFDLKATDNDIDYIRKFIVFNSIGFLASLSIIILMISGLPLKNRVIVWIFMIIMWVVIASMALAYLSAMSRWTASFDVSIPYNVITYVIYGWIVIIVLGHAIRLIVKLVRYAIFGIVKLVRYAISGIVKLVRYAISGIVKLVRYATSGIVKLVRYAISQIAIQNL